MPTLNWLKERPRTPDTRPPAHARGYDRHWQKIRLFYLRQHPLCMWPGGCGKAAEHVHHIKPLAEGGTNAADNLCALCRAHHDEAHSKNGG